MNITFDFRKFFGNLLIALILLLAIFGFLYLNGWNLLPSKLLLISVVLMIFFMDLLLSLISGRTFTVYKTVIFVILFSVMYISVNFLHSVVWHKVYYLDFFTAYLSFIYLIIIAFLYNKIKIDVILFRRFFFTLLFLIAIKYSLSKALGFMHRPGIFTENNYELLFLALLILAYYHVFGEIPPLLLSLIFTIYVLAESRSGILELSCLLTLLYAKFSNKKAFLISLIVFITSVSATIIILKYRTSSMSIEDIDRFHFLMVFLREIQNWNIWDYLFGKHPLTPLSYESCQELSFYKSLFSYSGNDVCYAVILHSFVLRVLFNHGVIGMVFIFWAISRLLLLSGYSRKEALTVIFLLIINGLSVSSVNNIFTVIGILFLTNLGNSYKIRKSQNVPKLGKI